MDLQLYIIIQIGQGVIQEYNSPYDTKYWMDISYQVRWRYWDLGVLGLLKGARCLRSIQILFKSKHL